MEARVGIEPTMDCFADSRLSTWLTRLGRSRRAEQHSALHAAWHGHPARGWTRPRWPCHDLGRGSAALPLCHDPVAAWSFASVWRRGGFTPPFGEVNSPLRIQTETRTVFQLSKSNKKDRFLGRAFFRIRLCSGFYPPPPRPGLVAMMVLSTTCPWAHTNMRRGLPCRSLIVSGLEDLNILTSGADDWILTSDLLLTGQAP